MKTTSALSLALLFMATTACSESHDSADTAGDAPLAETPASVAPAAEAPAIKDGNAIKEEIAPVAGEKDEAPAIVAAEIDATEKTAWVHYDLDTAKIVPETDAAWDLAFKRTSIKMNADVKALILKDLSFDAVLSAPEGDYAADAPVAGGLETDGLFFHSPSAWYQYNMETHVISSRNYSYVVQTNGGQAVKLAVTDYYNVDRLPAFIQIKSSVLTPAAAE